MADTATANPSEVALDSLARLPARQKLGIALAFGLVAALLAVSWLWAKTPEYSVLFSHVEERDGGQIIAALQQQNVPYRISDSGTAVLVPTTQVHEVRLRLASQGLPKGGSVGFELMESQKLGTSQFVEQVNYQRALEGELARTIGSLAVVRGARVHLAIPKQPAFLRDEQKPSASVVVSLQPGRNLEPAQVSGIVHLVSASVPQLSPSAISVLDQEGNLVSQPDDGSRMAGLDAGQLKFVREVEGAYARNVEGILTPLMGPGNVRARVVADLDFSQVDLVAETFRPNPPDSTAIRSQQTSDSAGSAGPAGVPGAVSNQPPGTATAPVSPASTGPTAATTGHGSGNRSATTNYELDKTIRHTRMAPGAIKRLSVAVVVNHRQGADGKGKATPLGDAELKQVTELVKQAVGLSTERGDTLNIANAPFAATAARETVAEVPIWKDPTVIARLTEAGKYALVLGAAFLLWSRLFKPLFDNLLKPPPRSLPAPRVEVTAGEGPEGQELAGPSLDNKLGEVRNLAKQDPQVVAGVIKEWVGSNEPQ